MYYDDEARQFNFLSGLIFGAVLGTALALLSGPAKRLRPTQLLRRRPRSRLEAIRAGVVAPVAERLAAVRSRTGPPFR